MDAGHDSSHGTAPTPDAGVDVTTPPDASVLVDAGMDAAPIAVEAGEQTWSSLYRDYFGPAGAASCAGNGNCHGSATQPGAFQSGFVCPAGDASAECWQGITSAGDGGAYLITPPDTFEDDQLSQVLCQDEGNLGEMPKGCTYSFTPYDLARIGDWVNAGALDN